MDKILLIDGHSILNRSYYGLPLMSNVAGIHTNAVLGFVNTMISSIEEEGAKSVAVAFDLKEPTFRHKMFPEYKGTRKGMPAELHEQVPVIKDVLAAMNIPVVTLAGFEADDILGTLAKRMQAEGMEVVILSGDRDLLQLADEHIMIRQPRTVNKESKILRYYPDDVKAEYGVTPLEFIDLKAIQGDSSDNIPGVPGIGEKGARDIIVKFHSIENAFEHADKIDSKAARNKFIANYDMAKLSKTLATIITDAPVEFDPKSAVIKDMYNAKAYELISSLEIRSLLKHFNGDKTVIESAVKDVKYTAASSPEEANEVIDDIISGEGREDLGIHIFAEMGHVIGFSLDTGVFIPVRGDIGEELALKLIDKLAARFNLIMCDSKKQTDYLPDTARYDDVSVMAYILNPLTGSYNYDEIAGGYLSMALKPLAALKGKSSYAELLFSDIDALSQIGAYNAYVAAAAYPVLMKKLKDEEMMNVYTDIEKPLIPVLRSMERKGIRVNKEALKAYGDELVGRIFELENMIYSLAGEKFNINSPKQLGEILFEKLFLPGGKKTKTGYSTSADVLDKLREDYPIVENVLEYRTLTKLKNTYADGLYAYIGSDERIHGNFNQMVTATGRISSTEPNLQNIPIRMELGRMIRKVFIPRDGYSFIDADYSQIELRLLAHMSGDKNLIEAYNEDSDIHRATASKVFHTPIDQVTREQRSNAKAVNFGIVYGISSFGLSQDLNISKATAKEYIDEYFKTYPGIKSFLDGLVESAKVKGYSTTMYGRRRPIPEIKNSNFMQRQFGERIAMNSPIQGSAADIIKIAMIAVYNRLKAEKLSSKLILQIHDELLIETAPGEEAQVRSILSEEMKGAAKLLVSLEIGMESGKNWYEAH